jgi:hypothetical protein
LLKICCAKASLKNYASFILLILFMIRIFFAFALVATVISCDFATGDKTTTNEKNYENSKESMEKTEQNKPTKFLTATASDKKNLIGQTVVKGTITNQAKVVTYKDVEVKLSFYSKTKAVVEQDIETIYENVAPGESVKFKSKFFTPKGTDSVAIEVLGAKF